MTVHSETRHVVVLSGGLDSTNALALALSLGDYPVRAVSFDYGQRHARELVAARRIAALLNIEHTVISLAGLLHGSSLLCDGEVPEGHYAAESMAQTVVNGRNLLFASAAVADCAPRDHLWFGVHAGDHHIYPDCRPEFWDGLRALVRDAYEVHLTTPFLHATKGEALKVGAANNAPFWLTWSCYNGGEVHCGRCGTCVERAEAFAEAGVDDPTDYADVDYWREVTA